jgi:glycosyltransferase involved in cell wall biosynthesis
LSATRTRVILSIQPVAERGGSDHALAGMARSLTQAGWECHIALPAPAPLTEEFAAAGARLHVVPMRRITSSGGAGRWVAYGLGWPVAIVRLLRLARRVDASVIHSNSLHSWYGWAVAALLRRPHVWHAREIVVQSARALQLERWLARHFATEVIAISSAVGAQLDRGNLVVALDQPDQAVFHPGRAGRFRAEAGIADDVPLIGSVGRIDTWKGVDVLLDAVPSLRAARSDVQVVIAGSPVQGKEAYAEQLASRAGRISGVHWVGPRADVADLLADLDVFVLPSVQPEPYGLSLVEALASGVPAVATAHGGPVEILDGAGPDAGRLVPPGDPGALVAATIDLLPQLPSSTGGRRARRVLREAEPPPFPRLFDEALDRFSRASGRWRRDRERPDRPRNAPR